MDNSWMLKGGEVTCKISGDTASQVAKRKKEREIISIYLGEKMGPTG